MMALFRAELRKLLTVRSTYIISILSFLFVGFLAFYATGYSVGPNPYWLSSVIRDTSTTISIFVALIAILLMCHEYRHNTIMYTLTSANSRSKVLFVKVAAVLAFTLVFMIAITIFAALMYRLGLAFSPHGGFVGSELLWSDVWRALYFVLAYTMLGLVLAVLLRHVVGAIASLFIIPTVEGILTLLLKEDARYLPFSTLEQVHTGFLMSSGKAALLFTVYLAAAWLLAWYLFLRRDAN